MDEFDIIRSLSTGSFSEACLVRGTTRTDQHYVLKRWNLASLTITEDAESLQETVLKEVTIHVGLRHPNVVKLKAHFMDGDIFSIVMEHCQGGPLGSRIKKQKETNMSFSQSQVTDWFKQIASALEYIHRRDVLHRALKPENIFLTDKEVAKIGDFGIAAILLHTTAYRRPPASTLVYMAPELLREESYDKQSDLWSLGVILYELSTLELPFQAANIAALTMTILKGEYSPLSSSIPSAVKLLVQRLLRIEPMERPTATQIVERLQDSGDLLEPAASEQETPAVGTTSTSTTATLEDDADFDKRMSHIGLLKEKVWKLAKDGQLNSLKQYLQTCPPDDIKRFLSLKVLEDNGQATTPLNIAAMHGREDVVRCLVDKYGTDIEQRGSVYITDDGRLFESCTSIWMASHEGHVSVVRALAMRGADVNAVVNITLSFPLRTASFIGHLHVIQCLVENGANVNQKNSENCTALMNATLHPRILEYLLKHGADPDIANNMDCTALHFAGEDGNTEVMELLLNYHAKILPNSEGLTPLLVAASKGKASCVEKMCERSEFTREDKVNALELLGAEDYQGKLFHYLERAMKMRFEDKRSIIRKEVISGFVWPGFGLHKEAETMEELQLIKHKHDSLVAERMAVLQRIYGADSSGYIFSVTFQGALHADNKEYDKAQLICMHAITLKFRKMDIRKELEIMIDIIIETIAEKAAFPLQNVVDAYDKAVHETERIVKKTNGAITYNAKEQKESTSEIDALVSCVILLLCVFVHLKALSKCYNELLPTVMAITSRLVRIDPRVSKGKSLLHVATDQSCIAWDNYSKTAATVTRSRFPNVETLKLLLRCGADPHVCDNDSLTPAMCILRESPADSEKHRKMLGMLEKAAAKK